MIKFLTMHFYAYVNKKPVFKEKITRDFYKTNGIKVTKHLQFSVRPFYFENEYYILLIIDDITNLINQQETIDNQLILLNKLRHKKVEN